MQERLTRRDWPDAPDDCEVYNPPPGEIREECRKIRNEWSAATHRRRAVCPDRIWTLPIVRLMADQKP